MYMIKRTTVFGKKRIRKYDYRRKINSQSRSSVAAVENGIARAAYDVTDAITASPTGLETDESHQTILSKSAATKPQWSPDTLPGFSLFFGSFVDLHTGRLGRRLKVDSVGEGVLGGRRGHD